MKASTASEEVFSVRGDGFTSVSGGLSVLNGGGSFVGSVAIAAGDQNVRLSQYR
jgi:hypothetical protein